MIYKTLLLVVLILINGVFSSSEIAFLSIDKIKLSIDKKKNKKARIAYNLLQDTNRFLATIQVAITFAGFLASAFAADTYVDYIIRLLDIQKTSVVEPIIMVAVTLILSYFTLLFGELIPKRIGLSNPEKTAYAVAPYLLFTRKLFTPFVYILTKSVNRVSKLLKIEESKKDELTEDRIKTTITFGRDSGVLEVNEANILMNVFEFNDTTVKEVMTKEKDVISVDLSESTKDIMNKFKKYKFTRYPVTSDNNIIGIISIKDLIISENKLIKNVMKKPHLVLETDEIDHVFLKMKELNVGMMIVENKGIVTLEDIIEELVGNIKEELN